MANVETIQVKGLPELRARLQELARAPDRRSVTAALKDGAEIVRADAQRRAPVSGHPHRLGRSRSIVMPGFMRAHLRVSALRRTEFFASVAVYVKQRAFYWRFVEFGTRYIRARPFLRPALEVNRVKAAETIVARLRERIETAIRTRMGA